MAKKPAKAFLAKQKLGDIFGAANQGKGAKVEAAAVSDRKIAPLVKQRVQAALITLTKKGRKNG